MAIAPLAYRHVDLGPAQLELVQADTLDELQTLLSPPEFNPGAMGQLQVGDRSFAVASVFRQPIGLGDGLSLTITVLWPDFRLDASNQPKFELDGAVANEPATQSLGKFEAKTDGDLILVKAMS